jgi:excisionase family DNA binding protein
MMNNVILSTRNIDDLISDIANEVVKKIELWKINPQTEINQPEKLLTVQEVAAFLHLSVPTIYSKVSRGELPVMKRSKRLYFSRIELVNYIKEGRKKTIGEIEGQDLSDFIGKGTRRTSS